MRKRLFLASLVIVFLALNYSHLSGQQQNNAAGAEQPWPWPDSYDALTAAPKNHLLLLENDRVRVLDVTVLPGEKENTHSHRWPSVLYIDKGGPYLEYDVNGKMILDSRTLPPRKLPLTEFSPPQTPHSIENLSKDTAIHLIRVEIMK